MSIYIWAAKIEDYSAMRGPCPEGYHIPSNYEWNSLYSTLITSLGLAANRTTMRQYLKMPPAGYRRQNDGGVVSQGSRGDYRSCTVLSNAQASFMQFTSSSFSPETASNKTTWVSIRWFKNSAVVPDSSWTTLYDWSSVAAWAWIYYNATLWLISISWDGKKWYTIQDKNLWATVVYNSWDTLSETNCGYYYQRWNNYWFAFTWTLTTSSTRVNASSYWPWNYYSSSTFITWSASWDTSNNPNLWWWQNRTPSQVKNVYVWGYYEYSYDFRNKTISEFGADGWIYDDTKAPSFNSDWIYYTSMTSTTSGGIELNYILTSAKKITLNTSFVITNSTTHLWVWWINSSSWTAFSWIMLTNMLGSRQQQIQINNATVTTTNVSVSTWTYTETIEYDLINKTYTYSGCYPSSWTLTDEQISWIKNNNGITVAVGGSSGIKISTIDLVVKY